MENGIENASPPGSALTRAKVRFASISSDEAGALPSADTATSLLVELARESDVIMAERIDSPLASKNEESNVSAASMAEGKDDSITYKTVITADGQSVMIDDENPIQGFAQTLPENDQVRSFILPVATLIKDYTHCRRN